MRQTRSGGHRPPVRTVVAVVGMLAAAACSSAGDKSPPALKSVPPATRAGGTVTIAAEQFPPNLNVKVPPALAWTGRTAGMALARGYRLTPDFRYEPWLFDGDCKASTAAGAFTVSCAIVKDAKWSDGVDITADDFKFTVDLILANNLPAEGYSKIKSFDVKGPKAFDMVFSEPYVPWRSIWTGPFNPTLPKHVLENKKFSEVWSSCICADGKPFGSGPFLVDKFNFGEKRLEMVRNDAYWGSQKPSLDRIVFTGIPNASDQVTAIQSDVDMIYPTVQLGLSKQLRSLPATTYEPALGVSWEHLDLLTTVPGLADVEVRKAIATALPRQELVDELVKPDDGRAKVLNNVIYMNNQPQYKPNWSIYPEAGDPVRAAQILERAGYVRDPDGVYAKGPVTLSFTIGVPTGNTIREAAEVIVIDALKKAGIALKADGNYAGIVAAVGKGEPYNVTIFAWTGQPDPGGATFWRDDAPPLPQGQNTTRLSNAAVTAKIKAADAELDEAKRADLYNQADDLLAREGVSSIPLFQRPQPLVYHDNIVGVRNNPTVDSFTWNAEAWALKA